MTSFFGVNDSFFGTNTSYSANNNVLGDYAMIKNGTYKKLLNAYYTKKSGESTDETEESKEKKSEKTKLMQTKSQAEALKSAADDLKSGKIFEEITDEDGKVTYNTEEIAKKVKSFVSAYNDMLDASSEVDTKSVLRKTLWMIGNTKSNSTLLDKVGISIGKDNKLSVDEEKLKKADISSLKVLFSGKGSLADKVSSKASEIGNLANSALKNIKNSGSAYTNTGDYKDISTSTLYDGLF